MKITVVGTGYVGLVTGVSLSDIGHQVTCIDIDSEKIERMRSGISPIYEPGLTELMVKNIEEKRLFFTTNHKEGFLGAEAIYIAVGTPEKEDGSANLSFVERVAKDIATNVISDVVVVTKSTVPVGTNDKIHEIIQTNLVKKVKVDVVSNPEFLREGSAIHDTFHGDRIVIGANNEIAGNLIEEINRPFGIPVFKTDLRSAEMIKYASNAFLATKISFINEVSNICERLGANIEDVAFGMGQDSRIGNQFLKAGIGYGGSCFPKDTKALIQISGNVGYEFELLKGVVKVNQNQQKVILDKLKERFDSIEGKKVAVLGLAFKPNTDDMREAASIVVTKMLIEQGAEIIAYDPVANKNAKKLLSNEINFVSSVEEALNGSEIALILTEWNEIKQFPLEKYEKLMKEPIIFDGRNCYELGKVRDHAIEYYSIGRPNVEKQRVLVEK
ncbi:UDP-glucose/GDP-mannose dehydrogenase family protein [Peribacillus simplex]|uniref:UDP-glucose dehydrogenase family protein n=1 Tax=Peribacillus simplex TaxID=1478 RepID=UPI002989DF55|nr:UDP-glucose/GDP-mannose dehydrogenase family protein [Peribacillus simplex]MBX9954132.1 UDP-glucose/GDP-mannose dehydrogenase family protein [Peribacillus simplex]